MQLEQLKDVDECLTDEERRIYVSTVCHAIVLTHVVVQN